MTEMGIAEIVRDGEVEGYDKSVRYTVLSNGYVISTVNLVDNLARDIDKFLATAMKAFGVTREDMEEISPNGFFADTSGDEPFETMVFFQDEEGKRDNHELGFARYMSREEAEKGHADFVEKWRRMK